MYSNEELNRLLHNANSLSDLLNIQTEVLQNAEEYLQIVSPDYFIFIGIHCRETFPKIMFEALNDIEGFQAFNQFTYILLNFETFLSSAGFETISKTVQAIEQIIYNATISK